MIKVCKHLLADEIKTGLKLSKRFEQFSRTLKAIEKGKQNKILTIKKIEQKMSEMRAIFRSNWEELCRVCTSFFYK